MFVKYENLKWYFWHISGYGLMSKLFIFSQKKKNKEKMKTKIVNKKILTQLI